MHFYAKTIGNIGKTGYVFCSNFFFLIKLFESSKPVFYNYGALSKKVVINKVGCCDKKFKTVRLRAPKPVFYIIFLVVVKKLLDMAKVIKKVAGLVTSNPKQLVLRLYGY